MKHRHLLALIALAAALVAGGAFAGLPTYTIHDIGLVGPDEYGAQGRDVSTVAGWVTGRNLGNNNCAWIWSAEAGLTALPNHASRPYCEGNAVNFGGTVVGTGATTFYGSSPLPLVWTGGVVAQLPLPAGESMGRANGLNNLGVAVGSANGGSLEYAVIYDGGSALTVGPTASGCRATTLFDINDAGLCVGTGIDPADASRNVGYCFDRATGTAFEVGALPGRNGALCFGVGPAGHVVGASMYAQGNGTPFVWTQAGGMVEIPLPTGASTGSGRGANSDGWVVGNAGGLYAVPFLWDTETTYRIQDLVPEGSGWDLSTNTSSSAEEISDDGIIIGTGIHDGVTVPYALVPDPTVPTLLQSLRAVGDEAGVEVTWRLSLIDPVTGFRLERAAEMAGPWSEVAAAVERTADGARVLDTRAEPGRTTYYRLVTEGGAGDLIVVGYVEGRRATITGVSLAAPWPNPANGAASVSFRLPSAGPVELTVHDLRGRRVRTLVSGTAPYGDTVARWDGRDEGGRPAPAGVYFMRLATPSQERTRRVVLTR